MKLLQITTKNREQIAAEFDAVFKTIEPPEVARRVTQADRLAPYRKVIMKQRRRGLKWDQIAAGMAEPPILEKVSARLLKAVFGGTENGTNGRAGKPRRASLPSVEPVTGQPGVVAAPPAPMTPKEHELYDRLLVGLIPPIVKVKMNRRDARSYANNAVEMMRPKEAQRLHELLTAELDGLTEANCARWGVPPEEIAPWKRKWA